MNEHRANSTSVQAAFLRPSSSRIWRGDYQDVVSPVSAVEGEIGAPVRPSVRPVALSSLVIAALVGLGLAAVEAARLALVYEALGGFFAEGGGGPAAPVLPFAAVLTFGLGALDAGLLLRMFAPSIEWRGMAVWSAIGAWLVTTTANSILAMYAVAGMMDAGHQLYSVAPVGVAIALLLLRVLLVGALAWDAKGVVGNE